VTVGDTIDMADWMLAPMNDLHVQEDLQAHVRSILELIGEDPNREGLQQTPRRVAKAYAELFSGYGVDPAELFTQFDADEYDSMVILSDIPFTSFCEHHILPFIGIAHVGYVPSHKIVGVSKLARLVDVYAKRLQVQERLTVQIADTLDKHLQPLGVMVVLEASHSCMSMRGIGKAGKMITSALRGVFLDPEKEAREEFLRLTR
jgi:GTP cyclohydrolase IA